MGNEETSYSERAQGESKLSRTVQNSEVVIGYIIGSSNDFALKDDYSYRQLETSESRQTDR